MTSVRDRLGHLKAILRTENANLEQLEKQKRVTEEDIAESQNALVELQKELQELQEILDVKTRALEQVKRTTAKATKALDLALKEIASMVYPISPSLALSTDCFIQNDEIEKLASLRSNTYRKCRMEGVKLPLLEGHLKNVPMEEVRYT